MSEPMEPRPLDRWSVGGLLLVTLLFLVIRLWMARLTFIPNFDTGTVGLMGLRILEGDRPLFFYGQSYMGALEGYLAAVLFLLFGVSSTVLALSPILFSCGWLVATWFLFREITGKQTAAWMALALVFFPNWLTVWYSLASYGGYPGCYFWGTLCWWACVRLHRSPQGSCLSHALVLCAATSAGLALWTNLQAAVFVAMGAGWFLPWLLRRRNLRTHLPSLLAGGLICMVFLLPVLLAGGDASTDGSGAGTDVANNLRTLFTVSFKRLYFEPGMLPPAVQAFQLALVIWALALGVLVGIRRSLRHWNAWIFWGVYSLLYILHPMAGMGAARYLIPGWQMLLCAAFVQPLANASRRGQRMFLGLGGTFVLLSSVTAFRATKEKAPRVEFAFAQQAEIVEAARAAGVRYVDLAGDPLYGHRGQAYTFAATNQIQFVSVYDERIQSRAIAAEIEAAYGIMYPGAAWKRMKSTFLDLDLEAVRIQKPAFNLAAHFELQHCGFQSVRPSATWRVQGDQREPTRVLGDRDITTSLSVHPDEAVAVLWEFERPVRVGMLWLTAPGPYQEGLPRGTRLEGSLDGREFFPIHENPDRIPQVYRMGDRVYAKGFQPRMEVRFPAQALTFLRLWPAPSELESGEVQLNEVWFFEETDATPPAFSESLNACRTWLKDQHPTRVVADRQISAHLLADGFPVYERFNPKFPRSMASRIFSLEPGVILVVESSLAGEVRDLLVEAAPSLPYQETELAGWRAFTWPGSTPSQTPALLWNGHAPLRVTGPEPPWR